MNIEVLIRDIVKEELSKFQNDKDETLTTDEFMVRYKIKSKSTLGAYHRMGLPYFKGKPNIYFRKDIENFFRQNQIRK